MSPRKSVETARGQAEQLALEAQRAARVRALATNPDVIALQVERVRTQVDWLMWTGIILGLAFCMTNVQEFAAGDALAWSPQWTAAWLLDPMVSLVLIAVIRAEQITARWQVASTAWARRTRWTTVGATYAMNTWEAWSHPDVAMILAHSVPPLVVFVASEAAPGLRDRLTAAVYAAAAADPSLRAKPVTVGEAVAAEQPASPQPVVVDPETTPPPECLAEDTPAPRQRRWEREELLAADSEARVGQVMDLLRDGLVAAQDLTGEQVGAIFGQSPRNGRRALQEARRRLELPDLDTDVEHEVEAPGGALVLVGSRPADRVEVGA
ncbi:hypothetical protein Psed_6812 (plasmid) [Pseudonocardia dioxanivorans CB1190]|uniref:DUF2637 domain-containing protein n=1 Tax=Pseudonocardia dioxanivorans (strain ATCC 55486 / DSM 44775 / JCM 13855 / CB1190) TaxID=675635 RepID=F2L6I9_PSEUX|nr:hypothetical protein [Pseudonocardia dioxanivorans]AEA28883.1 hypothetical protein Psed_6812 [Pseudonocardia dioxanivorans CB1190]